MLVRKKDCFIQEATSWEDGGLMFKDHFPNSGLSRKFLRGGAQGSGEGQEQGEHSQQDLKQTCWHQGRLVSSMVTLDLLGTCGSLFPQGPFPV